MKKLLKYSGFISLVLVVVAFILMMATNSVIVGSGDHAIPYSGVKAIFGETTSTILGDVKTNPSVLALLAWIFILVGLVIVLLGIILPLLKVHALEKFAGLLNLVAVLLFVVAGVFMFIVVPTFASANSWPSTNDVHIGAGWVIGGILSIVGGVVAILPAAADFLGKM